jgi:UDP-galactopyranose mutase
MIRVLIIGGGFAGCAAADQFSGNTGKYDVTLIERSQYLGAGNRTQLYGGHPYTFGPRHFLTQDPRAYEYLNAITPIRLCPEHQFITYVETDSSFYNFPINKDDIPRMPDKDQINHELSVLKGPSEANDFEQYWVASVGETLYSKFVKEYNKKMWMIDDNCLFDTFKWSPKGIPLKEGPRAAWDTAISGYPYDPTGYNPFFDYTTRECNVHLNTNIEVFDIQRKRIFFKGEWHQYDIIINTISPSDLFHDLYGPLPFIGRDLIKFVLPSEQVFPENVYFIYFSGSEPFTRLVEYKKFTRHKSPHSLIGMEIPSLNGKHYPLPMKKWQAVADMYLKLMPQDVYSIGRAGSYRYEVDIDDSILQALELQHIL